MRHNEVREFTAELLKDVCHDVQIEPLLKPMTGEILKHKTANVSDEARVDISSKRILGAWTVIVL